MYLERATVLGTLGFIARLPEGSGVVFDYAISPATLTLLRRVALRAVMRRVAAAGEPWKSLFEPRALAEELRTLGFRQLEDLGAGEINARFFNQRADGLRVGGLGHVMSARS
jgi:O-methyltransferase involved in polyketide biosynthesis